MMEAAPVLYKRDQVERAIARLGGRVTDAEARPDPALKATLKRLLDLDRKEGIQARKGHRSRYAFFDANPPGKGVDQVYGFEAAFRLLLGERLLQAGLTQQRAVIRIRAARPTLDPQIRKILEAYVDRTTGRVPSRGALPMKPQVEEMIFWITPGGPAADLEMSAETFCSADEVKGIVAKSAIHSEVTFSIELVTPVLGLRHWLDRMPIRTRGRS